MEQKTELAEEIVQDQPTEEPSEAAEKAPDKKEKKAGDKEAKKLREVCLLYAALCAFWQCIQRD